MEKSPALLQNDFTERFNQLKSWEQNMIIASVQRIAEMMDATKIDASPFLDLAVWRRGKVKDMIVHSDRGSTYASSMYQQQLINHQLICSMSRKGECLDNAVAESFFGTLKTEWVDDQDYKTKTEAKQSIFEYIEVFYNRQ